MRTVKRHEIWRQRYRDRRDLDHLTAPELSERMHDAINNIRIRDARGKLSVRPLSDPVTRAWFVIFTECLEECELRGYDLPGPIDLSPFRRALTHAFDPIPDVGRIFDRHGLPGRPHLLKFGEARWLAAAMERGEFRIASAASYDLAAHNHARRDRELTRQLRLSPRDPRFLPTASGWLEVATPSDYYLFSLSAGYSARLFGDFAADACLVIFDTHRFVHRLQRAVEIALPGWDIRMSSGYYFDPVRTDPSRVVVPEFKPFRHAYQEEVRLIATPPTPMRDLTPVFIKMGPLDDCAALADLTTCPPITLPPDPRDDPIQVFGDFRHDPSMVNRLPPAARIQGISLDKGARRHEDWTIKVQYTDAADAWHELSMPMLDALHLLNLLRTAESEQALGLWNRPPPI
jgi:hypothetical protein